MKPSKKKVKKIKAWGVLGIWGYTIFSQEKNGPFIKKEVARLKRIGFDSQVVPVEISLTNNP